MDVWKIDYDRRPAPLKFNAFNILDQDGVETINNASRDTDTDMARTVNSGELKGDTVRPLEEGADANVKSSSEVFASDGQLSNNTDPEKILDTTGTDDADNDRVRKAD